MNKTLTKIGISLFVTVSGLTVPLVPEQLELQYSYQYPASAYSSTITFNHKTYTNPQPNFSDDNNDGLISVSVFTDNLGNEVYQQIDEAKYSLMGKQGGHTKNPTKSELKNLLSIVTQKAEAAIAYDTSTNGGLANPATSLTFSHTTSGSNRFLAVGVFGATLADNITGVTYNGVSMTRTNWTYEDGGRAVYLYSLINPSTGANNVVITANASIAIAGNASSYTGVSQTGQPDVSTVNSASAAASITTTLTTGADNDWTVLISKNDCGAATAGTGATLRQSSSNGLGIFDSNSAITPASSYSMTVSNGPSCQWGTVMASFAPLTAGGSTNVSNNLIIFE